MNGAISPCSTIWLPSQGSAVCIIDTIWLHERHDPPFSQTNPQDWREISVSSSGERGHIPMLIAQKWNPAVWSRPEKSSVWYGLPHPGAISAGSGWHFGEAQLQN